MGDSRWQSCVMCGYVLHDNGRGFSSELLACLYRSRPEKPAPANKEPIIEGTKPKPKKSISLYTPRQEQEYWQVLRMKYQAHLQSSRLGY
jgi:hypothetical protein